MEKPKCKLCGERHWGICPGSVDAFWRENAPLARPSEGDFVSVARKPATKKPKPASTHIPTKPVRAWQMYAPAGKCEYCDRNRANALDRVKRYREIRKAIEKGGE